MEALARLPRGSHIGQIGHSFLELDLPEQFLTRYDYEFLYALRCALHDQIFLVEHKQFPAVHCVMDQLVLYMIIERARMLLEDGDFVAEDGWDEWIYDIIGDQDILDCLYSDTLLTPASIFHFDHWTERQF